VGATEVGDTVVGAVEVGRTVGTGVMPSQQSKRVPSAVGQQSPSSCIAAHVGCALHAAGAALGAAVSWSVGYSKERTGEESTITSSSAVRSSRGIAESWCEPSSTAAAAVASNTDATNRANTLAGASVTCISHAGRAHDRIERSPGVRTLSSTSDTSPAAVSSPLTIRSATGA
jgi:hypothetical protein